VNLNQLTRKIHYWATAFIALPLLVIVCTGLLLQIKKQWTWVQPQEQRGTGHEPRLGLEGILASVQGVTQHGVGGWDDITRLEVRPERGIAKVWLHNGWEVQVDMGTGAVLQNAYRRSDVIESLHDGSFFAGDLTRYGLFLPSGVALLLMLLTGLWMFWLPFSVKRKRRKVAAEQPPM